MVSFDIWSALIVVGVVQGIFVISLFLIKREFRNPSQRYLMGILLVFLWLQLEFLSIRWPYTIEFTQFYGTRLGSWFLIGPLILLYTHSLTGQEKKGNRMFIHFLPFIFFVLILPLFYADFLGFRQVHYGMLTVFDRFNREEITVIQYVYSAVFVAQFIHLFAYLMIGLRRIKHYETAISTTYSSYQESEIRWLRITIYSLMCILVFASLFLVLFFFTLVYRRHLDYIYVLPMSFLMYIIAYKLSGIQLTSIRESELNTNGNGAKYQSSSLKSEDAETYSSRLKEYMSTQKPYLKNGLRLIDLSKELEIPAHHLSQVINEKYDQNFYDFVNSYRVEEAKSLMNESDKPTLLEIAFSSGFNNKTSFNNAFKKFSDSTPFAYRKKLRSEKTI